MTIVSYKIDIYLSGGEYNFSITIITYFRARSTLRIFVAFSLSSAKLIHWLMMERVSNCENKQTKVST